MSDDPEYPWRTGNAAQAQPTAPSRQREIPPPFIAKPNVARILYTSSSEVTTLATEGLGDDLGFEVPGAEALGVDEDGVHLFALPEETIQRCKRCNLWQPMTIFLELLPEDDRIEVTPIGVCHACNEETKGQPHIQRTRGLSTVKRRYRTR